MGRTMSTNKPNAYKEKNFKAIILVSLEKYTKLEAHIHTTYSTRCNNIDFKKIMVTFDLCSSLTLKVSVIHS